MSADLNPVQELERNARAALVRATYFDEQADGFEADPQMTFAVTISRGRAADQKRRAAWLRAEAARLAKEGVL